MRIGFYEPDGSREDGEGTFHGSGNAITIHLDSVGLYANQDGCRVYWSRSNAKRKLTHHLKIKKGESRK